MPIVMGITEDENGLSSEQWPNELGNYKGGDEIASSSA